MNIPFNVPCRTGSEHRYVQDVLNGGSLSGSGPFNARCSSWLERQLNVPRVLMTSSCTDALELAALVSGIGPGDEVIMPSYTFVSTANAFALRGAQLVFVDVRPDTMNIDEALVSSAITANTKAIVVVHYAGVSCDMNPICEIARRHNLLVIEDAAQALMSKYRGNPVGTLGHMAAFSFHETKNYTCGEGGALAINRPELVSPAEIAHEKGTDRAEFFRGQVDKYTWIDLGSSFLMSELQAAYLLAQFESAQEILDARQEIWDTYHRAFREYSDEADFDIPSIPAECTPNGHMYFLKLKDLAERTRFIDYLNAHQIRSVFHYVPLHSSSAGKRFGRFHGVDRWTTAESERLTRLPIFFGMSPQQIQRVVNIVTQYLEESHTA